MCQKKIICCVIVTYNPDITILKLTIKSIIRQVDSIVFIDNGSDNYTDFSELLDGIDKVTTFRLNQNRGLPYAQNMGIKFAESIGAEYVLFLDQDSIPFDDMVNKLFSALDGSSENVVAAGPFFIQGEKQKSIFSSEWLGIPFKIDIKNNQYVHSLISSGTLIKTESFKRVGYLKEHYFIDCSDADWCFRAKNMNLLFLGVCNAFMQHSIGYNYKRIWLLRWRTISLHTPIRNYYNYRNTIFMLKENNVGFFWILFYLMKLIGLFFLFLIIMPERLLRVKFMLIGIFHGIIGESGQLNLESFRCARIK